MNKVSTLSQASVSADEFALTHNVFTTVHFDKTALVPLSTQSRPKSVTLKSKEDRVFLLS